MAAFTIVAAVPGTIGLPGASTTPRRSSLWNNTRSFYANFPMVVENFSNTVLQSRWQTRGWTFQEQVLSRRVLYFSEFEVYFECQRSSAIEGLPYVRFSYSMRRFLSLGHYYAALADYTRRNLSYAADVLNAVVGVGALFGRLYKTQMLFGVPERFLPQALLWEHDGPEERREETPDIPSWSWAAWTGHIAYDLNSRVDKMKIGAIVSYHYQDPVRGLRILQIEESWFCMPSEYQQSETDRLYQESLQERFMPDEQRTKDAWSKCPHSPWIVSEPLDEAMISVARTHPGSLMFSTTAAFVTLKPHESNISREHSAGEFHVVNPKFPYHQCFDILDQKGSVVGRTAGIRPEWAKAKLSVNKKHEIIVLSAGILDKRERHILFSSSVPDRGTVEDLWYLHVMLIERGVSGSASRVSIGAVHMTAWKQCEPKWCTIVLV
jgi:hypothetical protein